MLIKIGFIEVLFYGHQIDHLSIAIWMFFTLGLQVFHSWLITDSLHDHKTGPQACRWLTLLLRLGRLCCLMVLASL